LSDDIQNKYHRISKELSISKHTIEQLSQLKDELAIEFKNMSLSLDMFIKENQDFAVVLKENNVSECPFPVIKDGTIDFEVLKMINKDKKWLMEYLKKYNYINEKEIFLCMIEENGLFIIKKD
jgi:hypothetical protein